MLLRLVPEQLPVDGVFGIALESCGEGVHESASSSFVHFGEASTRVAAYSHAAGWGGGEGGGVSEGG